MRALISIPLLALGYPDGVFASDYDIVTQAARGIKVFRVIR